MKSQPEVASYDPAEIRAATAITMPQLLNRWTIKDVQLFPSAFGPSVEMEIRSDDMGQLSLFAVRPGAFDVVKPKVVRIDDSSAAYFQIGDVAYVLVSNANTPDLESTASQLAETLY